MGLRHVGWMLLGFVTLLAGCGPRPMGLTNNEALERIRADYVQLVNTALASDETAWHSGWIGNWIVNWRGRESTRGLCYHWQELVYVGLGPSVEREGWQRVGVQMNRDHHSEHHAVVVFDPDVIKQEELLSHAPPTPAYVFDAWRNGRPEVYAIDDWLKGSGWTPVYMVSLEDLDAEYAERDSGESSSEPEIEEVQEPAAVPE